MGRPCQANQHFSDPRGPMSIDRSCHWMDLTDTGTTTTVHSTVVPSDGTSKCFEVFLRQCHKKNEENKPREEKSRLAMRG